MKACDNRGTEAVWEHLGGYLGGTLGHSLETPWANCHKQNTRLQGVLAAPLVRANGRANGSCSDDFDGCLGYLGRL